MKTSLINHLQRSYRLEDGIYVPTDSLLRLPTAGRIALPGRLIDPRTARDTGLLSLA
jgi:hypothetical protein